MSTAELGDMARRAVARDNGIERFVGDIEWLWSPGKGPIAHVYNLVSAPNVVPFRRPE